MKVVSFERNGKASFGLMTDDGVIDAGKRLPAYPTLKDLLAADDVAALQSLQGQPVDFPASEITYLPVVPNAGKIFCVGINYLLHMKEGGREPPEKPWIFLRTNDSIVGHEDEIIRPHVSDTFDWEVELGVIIGKAGRYISKDDALDHVAGYTVFNDGSIRAYQRHSPLWIPGKNFYRSGAMGPWMVPRAELNDNFDRIMETRLNGEVMQHETLSGWHFDLPTIIEYCSKWARLEPGDFIAMGTPSGVGWPRTPPIFMKAGDVVEVEIEGIGVLRNRVVDEA